MLVTNNSAGYYYLGDDSYPLPPNGSVTIPDSVYNNDDAVANAVNSLDEQNLATVTSAPAGYPRSTGGSGGISEVDDDDWASQTEFDALEDAAVLKALYDANTVLAANSDNTPAAVTMGASTILARLAAGNIKAASVAEILTLLQPPGTELAYVEFTSDVNVTATSEVTADSVVSAGSVAFDGSTRVCIEFACHTIATPGAGANRGLTLVLYDGSSSIGLLSINFSAVDSIEAQPPMIRRFITPSAASHTYSVRAFVTAGTGVVQAGAGGSTNKMPGYVRITKA